MKFKQSKLFIDDKKEIATVSIKQSDNYYSNLRKYVNKGYKQIIVPSDVMIKVLKIYFKEKVARILSIELLEEDSDYSIQLDKIINSIEANRDYFVDLIEELNYLAEKSTIEIKSVRFKYRIESRPVDITISVNGILTYNESEISIKEIDNLNSLIIDLLK